MVEVLLHSVDAARLAKHLLTTRQHLVAQIGCRSVVPCSYQTCADIGSRLIVVMVPLLRSFCIPAHI